MGAAGDDYARLGTTPSIHLPGDGEPRVVTDDCYVQLSVRAAQAAFEGSIWHRVDHLVVLSQVLVAHPALKDTAPATSIQLMRDVRPRRAEQLGMSVNLTELLPAEFSSVKVNVEFVLDRKNRLRQLGSLVQDSAFSAVVSLAPLGAGVATAVSTLAGKVIDTFVDEKDRKPVLQFEEDFNVRPDHAQGLRGGHYVIFGSRERALPDLTRLQLRGTTLYEDDRPVVDVSYVLLEVYVTPVRGRVGAAGSAWLEKLEQITAQADLATDDPYATSGQHERLLKKLFAGLREVADLLGRDPLYTASEARSIVSTAAAQLTRQLKIDAGSLGSPFSDDRQLLELTGHANLEAAEADAATYAATLSAFEQELAAASGARG